MISISLRRLSFRIILLGILASAVLIPTAAPAQASQQIDMTPATVRIGIFSPSLPMLAAQAKGFYAEQNITVQFLQVASSTQQFQFLRDNQYDVVQAATDNIANFRYNASNVLGATIDVQAFVGTDYGLKLELVARPGITSAADLRGKTVSVDAPNSGFALVLYKILRQYGLERDVDYTVVTTGGVRDRYLGLLAGNYDATLLSVGFETRAANLGFVELDTVYDIADPYMAGVFGAKTEWLEQNHDVAVRFILASYKASLWSFDPANREEAIGLLMRLPNTSRSLAEQLYAIHMTPGVGNIPDLKIDRDGLYNVLALRKEFNGFDQEQNLRRMSRPGSGLYDLSYYRDALRIYRHQN